jgi:membrane associated rhomboid family serine protease
VANFLVLILAFAGVGLYFMTPAERTKLLGLVRAALRKAKDAVMLQALPCDSFFDDLRARTPRVIATPCLIVLSLFIHSGVGDLLVSAVCLWQIGLILERLVGPLAFTTVYVGCAVAIGIIGLSASPDAMRVGASGPVLAMYGLLLVTSIWAVIRSSNLTMPLNVAKQLAPFAAVFLLHKLATTGFGHAADVAALVCGLAGGIILMREVGERTPQVHRLATAMVGVVAVVTLYALVMVHRPSNETVDIRLEVDKLIALEISTARLYEKEVDRFRRGRITAAALGDVIDKSIVPELRVVAGRLRALKDVRPEDQELMATAMNFLKLRDESGRLRSTALHKSDMPGLRQADKRELASLEAFQLLRKSA